MPKPVKATRGCGQCDTVCVGVGVDRRRRDSEPLAHPTELIATHELLADDRECRAYRPASVKLG